MISLHEQHSSIRYRAHKVFPCVRPTLTNAFMQSLLSGGTLVGWQNFPIFRRFSTIATAFTLPFPSADDQLHICDVLDGSLMWLRDIKVQGACPLLLTGSVALTRIMIP